VDEESKAETTGTLPDQDTNAAESEATDIANPETDTEVKKQLSA